MTETRIHSEFDARFGTDSRMHSNQAQEINQFVSDVLTDRDFTSVDYSFDVTDDVAELEATFVSEHSYKQETHEEAIELMVEQVFESDFSNFEVDFSTRKVEVEETEDGDE